MVTQPSSEHFAHYEIPAVLGAERVGLMRYGETIRAEFVDRPNRFVAHVLVDGELVAVHVKNTGRCRELLVPGCTVVLERAANPARKTPYDLVGVYKKRGTSDVEPGTSEDWLFNIDSQAPNKVAGEWLATQGFDVVKPEFTLGNSRFDFMMQRGDDRFLMEVKGCTLEREGIGYFPDAPTERGVKHLRELARFAQEGWHCSVAFVLGMEGVSEVRPNMATHPEFGHALDDARSAGVDVVFIATRVQENGMWPLE